MSTRTKHTRKARESAKAQRERVRILEAFDAFAASAEDAPEVWSIRYGDRIVRASLKAQGFEVGGR